jgi:hypothetical protein
MPDRRSALYKRRRILTRRSATTVCTLKRGISLSVSQTDFSCANVGSNTVALTVTDENGNQSDCTTTVIVSDPQPPVFVNCLPNLTVSTDTGSCGALVSWIEPPVLDNCGYELIQTNGPQNGEIFYPGTTNVTYELAEYGILNSTCSFNVTVIDGESPVTLCKDIQVSLSGVWHRFMLPILIVAATITAPQSKI